MKRAAPGSPPAPNRHARQTMPFRKRRNAPLPSREQLQRQSEVLQSAWRHFGQPGLVMAFLNTRHEQLDRQPLHLAVESPEGLARVQQLLEDMTLRAVRETRISAAERDLP